MELQYSISRFYMCRWVDGLFATWACVQGGSKQGHRSSPAEPEQCGSAVTTLQHCTGPALNHGTEEHAFPPGEGLPTSSFPSTSPIISPPSPLATVYLHFAAIFVVPIALQMPVRSHQQASPRHSVSSKQPRGHATSTIFFCLVIIASQSMGSIREGSE